MSRKHPFSIAGSLLGVASLVFAAACQNATARDRLADAGVAAQTTTSGGEAPVAAFVTAAPRAPACPPEMTLVAGDYCPDVEQTCLEWMDPPESRYAHFRCARYAHTPRCKSQARRPMRFCIETVEHREPGSDLPMNKKSWTDGTRICASAGMRLCTEAEWQFACEGEEMRPYAYGFERDPSACNVDIATGLGRVGKLVDHREPASSHPRCVSAFGVHDMAGNVDEWVTVEGLPVGRREVMKGSWWMPGRHACRSFQAHHGPNYGGTETGVRCCRDAGGTQG